MIIKRYWYFVFPTLLSLFQANAQDMNIIELRDYLLKEDARDAFTAHFEKYFIDSQNQLGAYVLSQCWRKDEPNRFVWIRGFADKRTRFHALNQFYGGDVWKNYGPRANELMLDSDNVLLLKPVTGIKNQMALHNVSDKRTHENDESGILVVRIYKTDKGKKDSLITLYREQVVPALERTGILMVGAFVCDMSENDFPRLPVIQDDNLLVIFFMCDDEKQFHHQQESFSLQHPSLINGIKELASEVKNLVLFPTLNSSIQRSTFR